MKQARKTSSILIGLVVKLAIVLMVLLVGSYVKFRMDFSKNKVYSLTQVSKDAVRKLQDNMVVKIYASSELPSEMTTLDRYVRDLLTEYKLAGKGKFHYEYITGLSLDELKNQAQQYGLGSMYFRIFENDKTTSKQVVYGAVFEYQGNYDSINLMPSIQAKLEYELTLRIQKLSRYTLPEITAFADTLYSFMPKQAYENALKANFNVTFTDLNTPPKQTPVMIFHAGYDSLSTTQLYNLDQYIMNGGKLVLIQDKIVSDGSSVFELQSNMFEFFENFGMKFSPSIAMDIFCDSRQMGVDTNMSFPIYPVLRGLQHPITRNISNIIMYMGSGIIFIKKPGLQFETILATSANSALLEGPDYQLDTGLFYNPDPEKFKNPPIPLGAIVQGRMESYFKDKPEFQMPGYKSEISDGKIVVYGDRELYIDPEKDIYKDRYYVILNAVDWLLDRETMINIRSRHMQKSILDIPYYMNKHELMWGDPGKTERRIKLGIKIVSTALPSLILIIIGGFIALRRKQRQRGNDEEE